MADRPISIQIKGPVPSKIICPSCGADIIVPAKPEGNKPMYSVTLECSCGKSVFLRVLTHGD